MVTTGVGEGAAPNVPEEPQEPQSVQPSAPIKGLAWVGNIRRFRHEVALEMKKVSWPTRTEVGNTTMVVIIAVFFFSFYLFGTDLLLSYLIEGVEWVALKIFG